jgi:hypothetical protein
MAGPEGRRGWAEIPLYIRRMEGRKTREQTAVTTRGLAAGLMAVGIFLFFGTLMALLAGITLVWPGTMLDRVWALNARAYRELAPFGRAIGIPFLLLSAVLAAAGAGWFRRRLWGWGLAVLLIAGQVIGNVVGIFQGRLIEGVVGFTIAGALLFYLLGAKVRAAFGRGRQTRGK